jgi:hypothetical protein
VSLKHALGLLDRAPESSIWFVAKTDADVAAAHRLATDIGDKHGRLALYINGPDPPSPLTMPPGPIRLKIPLKLALPLLRCRAVVLPTRPSKFSIALASAAVCKDITALLLPRLKIDFVIFNSQLPHLFVKIFAIKQLTLGLKILPNASTRRLHRWTHCGRRLAAQRPSCAWVAARPRTRML